ncbi:MAG: class I SAM-dependent methyltransferase [Ectothiorhodospiraceae bacterium]
MTQSNHWNTVYQTKSAEHVSWYRSHLETSLRLIRESAPDPAAPIIDVGGGASTLVDDLLAEGYRNITVADVAEEGLRVARDRLGARATEVDWQVGDITQMTLPRKDYAVWHDRAVFHFLVDSDDRVAYVRRVLDHVAAGGTLIMATFGPEGPHQCSGLDVCRYDAAALQKELSPAFTLVDDAVEEHQTPGGTWQQFQYARFAREAGTKG